MKKIPKEIYLQGNLRLNEKRTVIDARLNNLYSSFPAKEASPAGLPNNAIPLAAWIQERIDEEDIIITHPEPECDCEVELECTSTTCSFELPTFPPSVIYHYDLNIEDAVWTGDDATTARVVIKSGEEELLNIFYTGNFSCNDPCPNNYIQELLERVLQIYYGSIEGPTDYFTVILADNILLISSDTLKTFELSIIIGENTLDYTINNDSAFHTTTFSSEYVPAIELSESWSEFEDQYKLIWTINYTGEFQLSTTQNDITTVTHFTNISPVLSSGSCEDMTYELRHENVLIEEGEMVKTEITETKSICEAIEEAKYCTKSIPGSCDYIVEGIDLGEEEICGYRLENIRLTSDWVEYTFAEYYESEGGWLSTSQPSNKGVDFVDPQNSLYSLTATEINNISTINGTTYTVLGKDIVSALKVKYDANIDPLKNVFTFKDNVIFIVIPIGATTSQADLRLVNDAEPKYPTSIVDFASKRTPCSFSFDYDYINFKKTLQAISTNNEDLNLFININGVWEEINPIDIIDGVWERIGTTDIITDYVFKYNYSGNVALEGTVPSFCEGEGLKTFEVNINGQWGDETENVSEDGIWVLNNTTYIVTEWRIKDENGNIILTDIVQKTCN